MMDVDTRVAIQKAVGYISSDSYIAAHYGVTIKQVAHCRKMMAQPSAQPQALTPLPRALRETLAAASDRNGCNLLRDAMMAYYAKRAKHWRVDVVTAGLRVLHGYEPSLEKVS